MDYSKDVINAATWIVCPICDEKVCVGRFECDVIHDYLERNCKEKKE